MNKIAEDTYAVRHEISDDVYKVEYVVIDKEVNGLTRSTEGSAGYDLYAREDITIQPFIETFTMTLIPLNVKVNFPAGVSGRLYSRSSLSYKKNLLQGNSVGVIDNDYIDEIKLSVYNPTTNPITIKKGEKIAQLVFVKDISTATIQVDKIDKETDHKGFGSTGGYVGDNK